MKTLGRSVTQRVDLRSFLNRHRRRRTLWLTLLLCVVALLIAADRAGLLLYPGDDWQRYHNQTFRVTQVIDGDTIDLDCPDHRSPSHRDFTRIRLWGVDCPETAKAWLNQPAQPFGDEAAKLTRSMTEGRMVRVELQQQRKRDRFGRLLAYVTLDDGSSLNLTLIQQGLARADDRWSHDQDATFHKAQRDAKAAKLGIWTLPASRRRAPVATTAPATRPATQPQELR
jgi:micrococcal nuclease